MNDLYTELKRKSSYALKKELAEHKERAEALQRTISKSQLMPAEHFFVTLNERIATIFAIMDELEMRNEL